MGIDPKALSDQQIGLIAEPKERKAAIKRRGLGKTLCEVVAEAEVKWEKELHNRYISFLKRNEIGYIHADTHKRSTIKKGAPDFTVTKGLRYFYAEFKRPDGRLSDAQKEYFAFLERIECPLFIWYDYETAIKTTTEFFALEVQRE
jgi:hypothetical protein